MPANLTPEFKNAEARFRIAKTPEEKLAALEEMLATIPKHKGTDKMQADIKRRISKIKDMMQKKAGPKRQMTYHIPKEGAGQVIIIGPPNSGKSSLLKEFTNANPEIADYPFTTRTPVPGMMKFENILIQLVDMPPISPETTEGWLIGLLRIADGILFAVDLSCEDVLNDIETVRTFLENQHILLVREKPENTGDDRVAYLKTVIVGTKYDMPSGPDNYYLIKELYREYFDVLPMSVHSLEMIEDLKHVIFNLIGIIRIYSKTPGRSPDKSRPFIVKAGSTVLDVAKDIHQDFAKDLKYARIWGSQKYEGQRVNRDYVLSDEDILELHI